MRIYGGRFEILKVISDKEVNSVDSYLTAYITQGSKLARFPII
jgi:hypothetical protein